MSNRRDRQSEQSEQLKAFRKAAREAGCEDNEERFKDALRTVAKAKPSEKEKATAAAKHRRRT
jgi:hypothetical protein